MQVSSSYIYKISFKGEYANRVKKIEDNNSFFSKAYWNAEKTVEKDMKKEILEYQTWAANREGEAEGLRRTLDETKKNHSVLLDLKNTQLNTIQNQIKNNQSLIENLDTIIETQVKSSADLDTAIANYTQTLNQQVTDLKNINKKNDQVDNDKIIFIHNAEQNLANELDNLKVNHIKRINQLSSDLVNMIEYPNKMEETIKSPKKDGFGSIPGFKEEKKLIQNFFGESVILNQFGNNAKIPNGVLLYGLDIKQNNDFVRAISNQYNCNLIKITEANNEEELIEKIYEAAELSEENYQINNNQSIIFISEFDKKIPKDSIITETVKSLLDDISSESHATIFATSTSPEKIDDILLRDGRFDLKIPLKSRFNIENLIENLKYYIAPDILSKINIETYAKFLCDLQLDGAFSKENLMNLLENITPKFKKTDLLNFEKQIQLFKHL